MFEMTDAPIAPDSLRQRLGDAGAGAYAAFEGWIRNENEGREVLRLEYEAYEPLCLREGGRIIEEAHRRWRILHAACVHRSGVLQIGECAVWVGVSAAHRDEAFDACRYIIDQVKVRLPIWKKEFYRDGDSGWVNCERCREHAPQRAHGRRDRSHS
ncbi:MAG: molybdenum cofactor biosynthesis protein MoaE [Woeseiaceae bacterium]